MRKPILVVVAIILAIIGISLRAHAAIPQNVNVSFSPSQILLSQNTPQSSTINVNSGAVNIGYVHLVVTFDPKIVQLANDITPLPALDNIIKITPSSEANQTGRAEIILGISPANLPNAPFGQFQIATLNWVSTTGDQNQTDASFDIGSSQIVTTGDENTVINPQDETINVGFTTNAAQGLTGSYFNAKNFQKLTFTRIDPNINFNWNAGSPSNLINNNYFSVRWTGFIHIATTGSYTFYTNSDDGTRLWINNTEIINDWTIHGVRTDEGSINLTAGLVYPIKLEYFENKGLAQIQLLYSGPGIPKQIIPTNLYSY